MSAPRFGELDGLRGVAALLVVFCHLTYGYDNKYVSEPDAFVQVWWGAYGVQLFFMISGFVILMSAKRAARPSDFVISRLSRLYPAYWIALVLAIAWSVLFAIPKTQITWPHRAANVVMVQRWVDIPNADEVYWTLAIEMQFYVGVFLLLLLTRCRLSDRVVTLVALSWLAVAVLVATLAAPHSHGVGPQYVSTPWKLLLNATLAEWGPLFVAGMFAHLARSRPTYWLLAIGAGAVASLNAGLLNSWTHGAVVAAVVGVFMVVAYRPSTPVLTTGVLRWLGKVSYSLYIVHNLLAMWVLHLLAPWLGRTPAMLIALVVVLIAARVVHELGEVRGSRAMKRQLHQWQRRSEPSLVSS